MNTQTNSNVNETPVAAANKNSKLTVQQLFDREAQRVIKLDKPALRQMNGKTGREYQGFNQINLFLVATEKGFKSSQWLTHDQFKEINLELKEGEHGTPIFNHKLVEKEGKKELQLRYYLVFNKDQLVEAAAPAAAEQAEAELAF